MLWAKDRCDPIQSTQSGYYGSRRVLLANLTSLLVINVICLSRKELLAASVAEELAKQDADAGSEEER